MKNPIVKEILAWILCFLIAVVSALVPRYVVRNRILMQDTIVGESTEVSNIITDKEVKIGDMLCISSAEGSPLYIAKRRIL